MRICFIGSQIAAWGKIGGFGSNTRRLGRGLVARGTEVHVVVPRRRGQKRVENLDGMTVHGQSNLGVFFDTAVYKDINADIYHVQEPNIAGYQAQRAMPGRVHLVTSMDPREQADWRIELANATWSRRLKYPLQRFYEDGHLVHRAVRNSDGVYVESAFLTDKTRRLYKLDRDPGLLPKPVDIPEGPFEKDPQPLCVFLGRLDPRKRPEMFFQLAQRMPDMRFVCVGRAHDPSYQAYLEHRYFEASNLEVMGFVDPFSGGGLTGILSRAWVLVHPAAREGLPTAFQEASAHEMAVLAYVDPAGYVSRFGKVAAEDRGLDGLESDLRNLIGSGEWREKGKAGRIYNIENHSVEASVTRHLEVYREHLSRARSNRAPRTL